MGILRWRSTILRRRTKSNYDRAVASHSRDYLLELWLASSAAGTEIGRRLAPLGVEPQLFALLTHIAGREPVAPSVIAAEQGIPATTMRDNVERLVERGLVERRPNPDDGRSYLLTRTPDGVQVLEAGTHVLAGLYGALAARLPRPESEYGEVLAELRSALAAVAAADWRVETSTA
jgi:DNA-binding MarR family transcriptional regulator